ncbi:glycosyltransferase family 2 protein [Fictibacillus sp. FJAT-27399]|uniref:glycosyltransferase family 2 protein n=1 Tax=Fictibacillus sp. FJAT-27399 TaxID=1729689 RepID=UPI0007844634|nr:glycosyltransferase family 2 protein [Fictibacillus sp. FJAT-27399]
MNPSVSVIIPTFNLEAYINRAVESVLNQTYQDFEIIIVDDFSTDSTVKVVEKIFDERIHLLINDKNSGPSYSRNRALEKAKGEWIAFLDGDDWWEENRLELLLSNTKKFNCDMISDDWYLIVDGEERPWSTQLVNKSLKISKPIKITPEFLIDNELGMQPLIKSNFLISNKIRFDESLRNGEDTKLYLDCLVCNANCIFLPEPLYFYRARKGSLVTQKDNALAQIKKTTNELLTYPAYRKQPNLIVALEKRKNRICEEQIYYQFIKNIKERKYKKIIVNVFEKPQTFKIIFKRIPNVLNYRLMRHFKRR